MSEKNTYQIELKIGALHIGCMRSTGQKFGGDRSTLGYRKLVRPRRADISKHHDAPMGEPTRVKRASLGGQGPISVDHHNYIIFAILVQI